MEVKNDEQTENFLFTKAYLGLHIYIFKSYKQPFFCRFLLACQTFSLFIPLQFLFSYVRRKNLRDRSSQCLQTYFEFLSYPQIGASGTEAVIGLRTNQISPHLKNSANQMPRKETFKNKMAFI